VKRYIDEKAATASFPFVAYIGDGPNDFCPMLKLQSADLVILSPLLVGAGRFSELSVLSNTRKDLNVLDPTLRFNLHSSYPPTTLSIVTFSIISLSLA